MLNTIYGNSRAPIAVIVNKKTSVLHQLEDDLPPSYQPVTDWNAWIKSSILDRLPEKQRYNVKLFEVDLMQEKTFEQLQEGQTSVILECVSWLLDKMQPL